MLHNITGDLRSAARTFLRTPLTSAVVTAVLGIAIAANLTLFNVVDITVLRSSRLPDADNRGE